MDDQFVDLGQDICERQVLMEEEIRNVSIVISKYMCIVYLCIFEGEVSCVFFMK